VFYFFYDTLFLKLILASRTSGTFGFTPTAQADTQEKPKEPLFTYAQMTITILKNVI